MGWLQMELSPDLLGTAVDHGDGVGGGEVHWGGGLEHRWDSVTVILPQAGGSKHPCSNSSSSSCFAEKRK